MLAAAPRRGPPPWSAGHQWSALRGRHHLPLPRPGHRPHRCHQLRGDWAELRGRADCVPGNESRSRVRNITARAYQNWTEPPCHIK